MLAGHTRDLASGALVFDPARTLRVGRVDAAAALPPVPYSAFGTLRWPPPASSRVACCGPLGAIVLGDLSERLGTRRLTLLPGSVTSVSGAGLVMPYGGTSDGVSYRFQGEEVALVGVGGATGFEQGAYLRTGITLAFRDVDAAPGALLDLSGGGELAGAGFVSGRGGSTDARYFPLVRNTPDGGFSCRPWRTIRSMPSCRARNPAMRPRAARQARRGRAWGARSRWARACPACRPAPIP